MRVAKLIIWVACAAVALGGLDTAAQQQFPDKPAQRWEDFYARRAFPFDRIPPGALQQARLQLQSAGLSGAFAPPPISGTQWQSIGPEAIPISGTSIGRAVAIAVHPTDANTVYIGGAQGGVWKTTDGGANWTPLTDNECSLAMGSIALDPVNPDIIYAGTGEQHLSADSYYGCGVLRSENGGATWTQTGASVFTTVGSSARISRVAIAPSTAGTVATTTVLAASDDGLFRSLDGGANWSLVLAGYASDLVVHPTNDLIVWVALLNVGVYKSIDRGATWALLGGGLPTAGFRRINLGLARSGPDTLFASFENPSTGALLGIWRTPDGGTTWTQLAASGASCTSGGGSQCWYDMHVTVHPNTADTVFFGGLDLYRSTNGGTSFVNVAGSMHVDQHFMAFDPQNAAVVYAANDGGVYKSTNGGATWVSINAGLALTQFYEGISLHPSMATIIMGGTQDNGTLQYGGVPVWSHVLGGDGGFTAINHDDPGIRYAETQWSPNSGFSGPRRSDGGYNLVVNGINLADNAQFIPPLVMDPVRSSILYFGTVRLYRTTNGGDSWTDLTSNLGAGDITAIAPSASNPDAVYVGTEQGAVYVSSDGGVSWPQRTTGLPTRYVQDIAVDRADWQTAYVVVSGFNSGHVFRTTDGGQTWTDRSSGLPNVPVNAVVLDPIDRGIVMIGTDLGVFMSVDSGGTWSPVQQGLPNVAVFDIAYNPATGALIAATHGRGMFQLQLNRPLTLAVVPGERRDTVPVGNTTPRADSAAVVLSGPGAGAANWTASHTAAWVTPGTAAGTGAGTVRWTRNPTGLTQGTYVDTIAVTAPGAGDSPFSLFAILEVEGSLAIGVSPGSRVDTAVAGSTTPVPDSATVTLTGSGAASGVWTASAAGAPWITITTAGGTGSGTLRWSRSAAALGLGTQVATITVTAPGAVGSPFAVVDSFVLTPAAAAFAPLAVSGSGVSGAAAVVPGQAALVLSNGLDSTTAWTATHTSASWVTLTTVAGTGSDTVRWERTTFSLLPGTVQDTIMVVTASGDTVRLVDSFVVSAPAVAAICVADHLLGTTCLDATALRWLDLAGNTDDAFNLGDFLAYRARGGTAPPPPVVQRRQP